MTARNAEIAELSRAGKYCGAIPPVQRLLANFEKACGPQHRDLAVSCGCSLALTDAIVRRNNVI